MNKNSTDIDLTYRGSKIYESYQAEIDLGIFASSIEEEKRKNTIEQRGALKSDDFKKQPVIKYFSETFDLRIRFFEDVKKVLRF